MAIITLLTDFGTEDEYVGLMKGVILSINPSITIVDISHRVDAQDIVQAAFAIYSAYRFFPAGTVHLIVVDPGVGTGRDLLALETKEQFFIAPDNGVLSLLLKEDGFVSLTRISNPEYFLATVSRTFHGRDIIAPVGAYIAGGLELAKLGAEIDVAEVVCLDNLQARILENGELVGRIITIDRFGNLISNIDSKKLDELHQHGDGEGKKIRIKIGAHVISGLSETYDSVASQAPLALIGSRGYLEVSVNKGNAGMTLGVQKGDSVRVLI
jgi:S-adenosylmethionine hydrolase